MPNGPRYEGPVRPTRNLRLAPRREREMIEEAGHGRLPADEQGPKRQRQSTRSDRIVPTGTRARGNARLRVPQRIGAFERARYGFDC